MTTLQELKSIIEAIENDLPQGKTLEDIPLQFDYVNNVESVEIDIQNYLGFEYAVISLS